jgi:hypothetical protein
MAKRVAKHNVLKHVIDEKVRNWGGDIFTVQAVADSEREVVIQFGRRTKYNVVKLDISDLPVEDTDGQRIHWINNFEVRRPSGRPVKNVRYTLFLPMPREEKATYVFYVDGKLRHGRQPKPKGTQPEQHDMLQIDLTTGDPGGGYKNPTA